MGSERLRVVWVGAGSITRAWLESPTVANDVEVVGIVDLDPEAAERMKAENGFDGAVVDTDLAAVLDQTRPDAVFDTTVPAAHHEVTLTALAAGCHVLGEKPMAADMDQARAMVAAARDAGKTYAVIQNRRFRGPIRSLGAFLADGPVGNLHTANADFYIDAHFGGFRQVMEHVLLLDMAIHSFDQARFLLGSDPVRVLAHEWTDPGQDAFEHGSSAQATFVMDDGAIFNYRGSWCAPGCNTAWECDWRLVGNRGTVCWDGKEGFRCQVLAPAEGDERPFRRPLEEVAVPMCEYHEARVSHAGVIAEFVDAVPENRDPETVCHDNVKSLAMVHAAIASAERGTWVDVTW